MLLGRERGKNPNFVPYMLHTGIPRFLIDADRAHASLRRLMSFEASRVLPGHGDPWDLGIVAALQAADAIEAR